MGDAMTEDRREAEEKRYFPREACIPIAAELNAWTSVQAIMASARHIEKRSFPSDDIASLLIMPMEKGELFEAVFLRVIPWMSEGYAIPPAKLALARALDPLITDDTATRLATARFNPKISRRPLADLDSSVPPLPNGPNLFVIEDEAHVIELLQAPLRCLMDILTYGYESAEAAYKLKTKAERAGGGAPRIYHRPYADSRLYATLEAYCYYAFGHAIGPYPTEDGISEIDISYRAVNVRGRPPVDSGVVSSARELMDKMHGEIH